MSTYTEVNYRSLSNYTAVSNSKESKWAAYVVLESQQTHPFKLLISGYKGGMPIQEIMDTRKLKGDTVYLTTEAPLGGAGIQGDNTRVGNEEKSRHNVYSFTVGMKWHGTAASELARSQTIAGANFDKNAADKLAQWLSWQQGWDIEQELKSELHGRNTIYANQKLSIDALGTGDYLSGYDVTAANTLLSTNGGKPISKGKSKAGAPIKQYVLMAPDRALSQWKGTSSFQNLLAQAQVRGDGNTLFDGGIPNWFGNYIYEYQTEIDARYGPVSCASLPCAVLGVAIAANNTAPEIKGGGDATGAALTAPQYFAGFRNATYTGFEGEKIATASTRRYWMIMNTSGSDIGKFGFYSGTSNDGNKLTSDERLRSSASGGAVTTLTGSTITWDTAPWTSGYLTDAHPVGSLVFEVNSKGVPFAYSYLLASDALICGYGSTPEGVAMAKETKEVQDHGRLLARGILAIWGSRVVVRTDGIANGYVGVISAFKLPGMPDVD